MRLQLRQLAGEDWPDRFPTTPNLLQLLDETALQSIYQRLRAQFAPNR